MLFFAIILIATIYAVTCVCEAKQAIKTTVSSLGYSEDSLKIDLSPYFKRDCYIIDKTIDLKGKTLYLPSGIMIHVRGGKFKNGIIKGDNTWLKYNEKKIVFDRVNIIGSWKVSNISTTMFATLDYTNSLRDVLALSNPDIKNTIYIGYGRYYVTAHHNDEQCLCIVSNSNVTIDGDIVLTPNNYASYKIIYIKGQNIQLNGRGTIVGDKYKHQGEKGEWGMGISLNNCQDIRISNLGVKDCWGDCIYISNNSSNVTLDGLFLDNGRRQGVSVISAKNVLIKNCFFTNIAGKAPQYAIDVEPNERDTVDDVCIDNVIAVGCKGGIMCYGKAQGAEIGTLVVKNSIIEGSEQFPLCFETAKNVSIEYNKIINSNAERMIVVENVDSVNIVNNTISRSSMDLPLKKAITVNNKAKFKILKHNIIY